ncbi:hypothetical protein GCM10023094_38790 [Rhodococcus olei]|uniref:Immunity protein 63 domain-containing protein n=1 Tax=Rhodococcus olei TaxID=2161675 RepID=A0ABP8PEF5_9NOCA
MSVVEPLNDDLLDHEMRLRILDVTQRLGALPEDLPALGQAHEDARPFCWGTPEGGWHLTVRERDRVLSDRHTAESDEFVFWVAESVSERISWRLHPPELPGFRAASWRTQYQLLRGIDPTWADVWLDTTRSALIAAGADPDVLGMLPTPP